MTGKKAIIILAAAVLGALVLILVIPSREGRKAPETGESASENSAHGTGAAGTPADDGGRWDFFPRLFSGMDDTGEYRRRPEERDSPGALTREMMDLIGRFATAENLPPELLLPMGTSKESVGLHMERIREILQYAALAKYGSASIEQRRRLWELKKEFFEEKAELIEGYREVNESEEDRKSSDEALGLLRDRIRTCEEELKRL